MHTEMVTNSTSYVVGDTLVAGRRRRHPCHRFSFYIFISVELLPKKTKHVSAVKSIYYSTLHFLFWIFVPTSCWNVMHFGVTQRAVGLRHVLRLLQLTVFVYALCVRVKDNAVFML